MAKTRTWFPGDDTKKAFGGQGQQQRQQQQQRPPQQGRGPKPVPKEPDFFLKGQKVRVHWLASGRQPLEGVLAHVSKYQLVVEVDGKPNAIIYKHAVERIEPIGE